MKYFFFQIVAVILCDTGVALLAYMDGITGSSTLSAVVLAAVAAAGSAVYKVRLYLSLYVKSLNQFSVKLKVILNCLIIL